MSATFKSPNNPLAAMWASTVESYVRKMNPGMPIQQVRRLPMMQGLYEHLSQLEKKKRVSGPTDQPALSGEALTIARNAYLSQEYFNLALNTAGFISLPQGYTKREMAYIVYDGLLNYVNHQLGIADFSTDDLGGFALCTIVWLGMTGLGQLSSAQRKFLQLLENQLPLTGREKTIISEFMGLLERQDYTIQYRDASDYPDYVAIPWQIPSGAQIVMLGDWGTGLKDAHEFLYAIWKQAYENSPGQEIVFIHLGDIYYCGLPIECEHYFFDVFQRVGAQLETDLGANASFNPNPPIFTLPGNHEYYSLGYGYFQLLDQLNQNVPNIDHSQLYQQCSFFCLRTEDQQWQFLGMDTGQADGNGLQAALQSIGDVVISFMEDWLKSKLPDWLTHNINIINVLYDDAVGPFQPTLRKTEVSWLKDRMNEFPGNTIMLSHHQLFSREATINHSSPQFMNTSLDAHFREYYSVIASWYWGHEHTFAIYLDGLMGLNKGRLLGSSSYEATEDNDTPYADNYPSVLFNSNVMDPPPINTNSDGLYYHAGAVLWQNGDDLKVKYYQFPAWTQLDTAPANLQLDTIVSDTISTSFTSLQPHWAGNVVISQDKVTTDYAPSITAWDDTLYLFYADGASSSHPALSICTANVASLTAENTAIWGDPNPITVDGSGVTEKTSTTIIAVDGILYGFYLDNNDNIQCITCATSGDVTSWTAFGSINDTVIGMAACFFQGCIYIVYLKTSNKLHWVYYNVTTEVWGDMGKLTDTNEDDIQSNIAPAVCADATRTLSTSSTAIPIFAGRSAPSPPPMCRREIPTRYPGATRETLNLFIKRIPRTRIPALA